MERLGLVGGDAAAARLFQVEGGWASLGAREVREHGANRPVGVRREVGYAVQQPRREVARAHERDAPHGCECEHVVQRAVGRALRTRVERLAQVGESVRAQPR